MVLDFILVDLDDTIYPTSSGLLKEIGRRMTLFLSQKLDLPEEKAFELRQRYSRQYGTTLAGLMASNQIDTPDEFLDFVHPRDVSPYLNKDPLLRNALSSISIPLGILTNSPMEHAKRILAYLELDDLFDSVFDLRYNGFEGKPSKRAYLRVLDELDLEACRVLFVDDHLSNLMPFRELGGQVLLVDEDGNHSPDVPVIRYLKDLPSFLKARIS
jgi:putative hydrolase of the HAD superfamily